MRARGRDSWKSILTREAEPYEHRLYSETPSSNLYAHGSAFSDATFLRAGKEPTRFLDTFFFFFRILMPVLIFHLALLSGSLRIFFFGEEQLRRGAEHILEVS